MINYDYMNEVVILSLIILGPLLGSALGVVKRIKERDVYALLSFAAGVMIAISIFNLAARGVELDSFELASLGIIFGAYFMHLLNKMVPHFHHHNIFDIFHFGRLRETLFYVFFGLFVHNFPEGMAIGVGSAIDTRFSIVVAFAIAVHDIPESLCTSAPYYYITKSRAKSFLVSLSTAIPTILGFIMTHYFVSNLGQRALCFIVSSTAGIMLYIALAELLPIVLKEKKKQWLMTSFLVFGVVFVLLLGQI